MVWATLYLTSERLTKTCTKITLNYANQNYDKVYLRTDTYPKAPRNKGLRYVDKKKNLVICFKDLSKKFFFVLLCLALEEGETE
jgi:hypothetical protein